MTRLDMFTQAFWDDRYGGHRHVWSGRPNPHLVTEVGELAPGRAIDVGCGEGGDAIWLAQQGWEVTGADVSPVGLERAAANAEGVGPEIARRITWRQLDLFADAWTPLGSWDLVNSQYLHLPPEVRGQSMQRLADAVAPGGRLLVAAHHPSDLEIPGLRPDMPELFCTPEELAAFLDPAAWEIVTAAAPQRSVTGPEGGPVTIRDTVLHARRR
ncbi:MAG TPA: class I SAM-dependent methyltransferase [Solirubrobacteraceae bacterium]|jgi:SAM-dependent methyltransferase|nr:class I SAM-dependent methyltransferase [Solirubrobacteraceae bacterium]